MKKIIYFVLLFTVSITTSQPIRAFFKENLDSLYSEALNGNANAAGTLGFHYYWSKNNDTNRNLAFKFLSMAVKGKEDFYLPELGECYYKGIGTEIDYKRAFECFSKDLNRHHCQKKAKDLYYLGECYSNGHGVKINKDKAVELYNQCVEAKYENRNDNVYKSLSELRLSELDKDKEYEHTWNAILENRDNVEANRKYLQIEKYSCLNPVISKKGIFPNGSYSTLSPEENSQLISSDVIVFNVLENSYGMESLLSEDDRYKYSDEAAGEIYLGNAVLNDRLYTPYGIDEKKLQIKKNDETSWYNSVLQRLLKAANLGNKEAFYHMGMIYTYHLGDLDKGKEAFETAFNNGNNDAGYEFALGLLRESGVTENEGRAVSILSQLSDIGHAQSIYVLAMLSLKPKEPSIPMLLKAGENGYSKAYYSLGNFYKTRTLYFADTYKKGDNKVTREKDRVLTTIGEKGLVRETEEGNKLFLKYMTMAADMGNSDALWALYLNTHDPDDEKKYLEEAAQLGNLHALNSIAMRHYQNKEYDQAIEYWRKSAILGSDRGIYNLGVLKYKGEGCKQSFTDAVDYFKYSSKLNFGPAHMMMASCYENGTGVEKDIKAAEEYYKKYANLNWEGWYKLAEFCYTQGTDDGYKNALMYYETAIKNVLINIFDEEGNVIEGIFTSIKKPIAKENPHFIPTDSNKDILGKIYYNLSKCYSLGRGVERNEETAAEYLRKSTALGNSDAQKLEEFFSSVR